MAQPAGEGQAGGGAHCRAAPGISFQWESLGGRTGETPGRARAAMAPKPHLSQLLNISHNNLMGFQGLQGTLDHTQGHPQLHCPRRSSEFICSLSQFQCNLLAKGHLYHRQCGSVLGNEYVCLPRNSCVTILAPHVIVLRDGDFGW